MDPVTIFIGMAAIAAANLIREFFGGNEEAIKKKQRERWAAIVTNVAISLGTGFFVMGVGYFVFGIG